MTKSTPTLTQSGLLAVLLQRQRYRVISVGPASCTPQAACVRPFGIPSLGHGARSRRQSWSTGQPHT